MISRRPSTSCLKFDYGFAREFLWIWQVIAVLQRFILKPGDIELIATLFYGLPWQPAKASLSLRPSVLLALSIRVFAIRLFKFGKVLVCQGTVLS